MCTDTDFINFMNDVFVKSSSSHKFSFSFSFRLMFVLPVFPKLMILRKQLESFIKEGTTHDKGVLFDFPPCNQVTSGYKAKTIVTALPGSFLDPLLSPSLMEDYELRQLVLEVMHNLMDRHDNRAKLRGIRYVLFENRLDEIFRFLH